LSFPIIKQGRDCAALFDNRRFRSLSRLSKRPAAAGAAAAAAKEEEQEEEEEVE
jgi:hypothetical protein